MYLVSRHLLSPLSSDSRLLYVDTTSAFQPSWGTHVCACEPRAAVGTCVGTWLAACGVRVRGSVFVILAKCAGACPECGGDSMPNLILARALSSNTVNPPVKSCQSPVKSCQILSISCQIPTSTLGPPRQPSTRQIRKQSSRKMVP